MARVLVTGASGFIGGHLVEALNERGDQLRCLVQNSSRLNSIRSTGAEIAYGDVTKPDSLAPALSGVDVVYHLAGLTRALRLEQLYAVNEEGVRNVALACSRQQTPPVMVLISSLAAAGPALNGQPRTEADPPRPVSNYGRSKRAGEVVVAGLADKVPISVVRPPIVFGENDRDLLQMIRPIVRFGVHALPTMRQRQFSLVHVQDLAQMLILAANGGKRLPGKQAEDGTGQGFYFVASDQNPSYGDLGRMFGAAAGRKKVRVVRTPEAFTWMISGIAQLTARMRGRAAVLNIDKAREATAGSWICSDERARTEIGYRPGKSLEERMAQTIQWYRQEGWL